MKEIVARRCVMKLVNRRGGDDLAISFMLTLAFLGYACMGNNNAMLSLFSLKNAGHELPTAMPSSRAQRHLD